MISKSCRLIYLGNSVNYAFEIDQTTPVWQISVRAFEGCTFPVAVRELLRSPVVSRASGD